MSWTYRPANQFAQFAAQWQRLNADGPNSPLLEPDFVTPLLSEFSSGNELLACYEQAGQMQAMTIVRPRRTGEWETFQPSQAPIGLWVQSSTLDQSKLMRDMMSTLPGVVLTLGVTQQDPALSTRPADSPVLHTMDYIRTAHIPIVGSFDDYWNARGKNLRTNLKKQRAKLLKDEVTTRMEISRAAEQMATAVADYGRLESAGWKAQGGTAIHPDNAQGRFYLKMLEAFGRRDAASVYRYWFGEQLVAMDFCIEGNGSIIVLKTTYDESVPNSLSPTLLMREEAARQIFTEAKFVKLEFYGKVMDWHTRWTDEIRTLYHITGYRWAILPALRRLASKPLNLVARLRTKTPGTVTE